MTFRLTFAFGVLVFISHAYAVDPNADFQTRCNAPDVVRCFTFDDANATNSHINPPYPYGNTPKQGAQVTDMQASGTGSLRFTVPSNSGSDSSGSFELNFSDNYSVQFGENQEFYVQWRQRFSPGFLDTKFEGGGGWKQAIIGEGDRPGEKSTSCTQLEIVTQNTLQRGFPQEYHSCGGKDGKYEPFEFRVGAYDNMLQNGDIQGCLHSLLEDDAPKDQYIPPCFGYKPNQWMTFQVRIKIGTWYQNDKNYHKDSIVQVWAAEEGQPSKMVINQSGYDIANTNSTKAKYGKVWLLPYNTGKSKTQVHNTFYVWYDELIISKIKIADPKSTFSDIAPPKIPANLKVKP